MMNTGRLRAPLCRDADSLNRVLMVPHLGELIWPLVHLTLGVLPQTPEVRIQIRSEPKKLSLGGDKLRMAVIRLNAQSISFPSA